MTKVLAVKVKNTANLTALNNLLKNGSINEEVYQFILDIDPSEKKKYASWMGRMWVDAGGLDKDELRNKIEEFHVFMEKQKTTTKDINDFKTFQDLANEVDTINDQASGMSMKDLEMDFETIVNNEDMYVTVPHTHEASRKLGLTHYNMRHNSDNTMDCAWCTTYKNPDHFNDYYYKQMITFYYVRVKSARLINKLKATFGEGLVNKGIPKYLAYTCVAVVVKENDNVTDAYDALDNSMPKDDMKKWMEIMDFQ